MPHGATSSRTVILLMGLTAISFFNAAASSRLVARDISFCFIKHTSVLFGNFLKTPFILSD